MEKLKSAIESKEQWNPLYPQINLIEENRYKNTNIALDNAKSILEAVAKTILTNKGVEYRHDEDFSALIKMAFNTLPIIKRIESKDSECALQIVRNFGSIVKQIGEFRNRHGFFSHGRDVHSKTFDVYLTDLVISSSDVVSSFLIIAHSTDLQSRSRIHYEDYSLFNKYLDDTSEEYPTAFGIEMQPSRFLFYDDIIYREQLDEFNNMKTEMINQTLPQFLIDYKNNDFLDEVVRMEEYFSDNEIITIFTNSMSKGKVENEDFILFLKRLLKSNELTLDKAFVLAANNFINEQEVQYVKS